MALRSFGDPPPFLQYPLWAIRVLTFVLPVWGAWIGTLTIFQVIWVYWIEGWILIPFLLVRIASARGEYKPGLVGAMRAYTKSDLDTIDPGRSATAWERIKMMLGVVLVRGGLLLFYLLFIIAFILIQVTQDDAQYAAMKTMRFENDWANSIWIAFFFQHFIDLLAHFFFNGNWRNTSPQRFASFLDRGTIVMHVMIVSTAILHGFVFEGKAYAAKGEVVYVAIFALLRLAADTVYRKTSTKEDAVPEMAGL